MIKILLVDDHALFREGLVSLLNGQPDLEVVGQAGCVKDAVKLTTSLQPDIILMDFGLPDGTGLDATQTILAKHPDAKIVFLTVHEEDDRLFSAIRCGARGYLLKNVPVAKLLTFIRGVQHGEAAVSRAMTSRIMTEFARMEPARAAATGVPLELTTRELEVLQVLSTGATNRQIAHCLVITESTVKNHVRSILTKLNLRNRREATHYAQTHGLSKASFNHT
jgi:two-component system NarL family response regulator